MKTCPKCNEILGDSVKVCVRCRYQFKENEMQEALGRSESVRKIAQERMAAQNKKRKIVFRVLLSICLAMAASVFVFGAYIFKGDGIIHVSSSLVMPFEYTITPYRIRMDKYHGFEKEVEVPNELWGRPVSAIGVDCFSGNKRIVSVIIPKTVRVIGTAAFINCPSLVEVTGGEEVEYVNSYAFAYCPKLETVDLGTEIRRIDWDAFSGCEQLKYFAPQDKLKTIWMNAFMNSGLEEFEFNPDAYVYEEAFTNTPWLDNHAKPFLFIRNGRLLYYYNGPEGEIIIPDGVETLMTQSFVGLADSEIFLPQTVNKINFDCFKDCVNIKIYIPSSVDMKKMTGEITDNCTDVTIVTTKGSYAEEYAREHEIPCEIVKGW